MHDAPGKLLIVGRGPSAYDFDGWDARHVMAVSSGVFALPVGVVPQHFVALDSAQYFNSPINDHRIAWQNDPRARVWPFWADESIVKHVHEMNAVPGRYKPFPMQAAMEAMQLFRDPAHARDELMRNFDWLQSHYGHQPNWGDYSNVRPWRIVSSAAPDFVNVDAPVGLGNMRNSVFMALQVAARLGYTDIELVGIFDGDGYQQHQEALRRWQDIASKHGISITRRQIAPLQLETAA